MTSVISSLKKLQEIRNLIGVLENNQLDLQQDFIGICNIKFHFMGTLNSETPTTKGVFKGCFTKACTFPVAIIISGINKREIEHSDSEIIALRSISSLILQGKVFPGFIIIGDGAICNIKDKSFASAIFSSMLSNMKYKSEKYSLFKLVVTEFLDPYDDQMVQDSHVLSICTQLLCSVCTLYQYYPQLIHFKLDISNLYYRKIDSNKELNVRVYNGSCVIQNYGYMMVLTGFDNADASLDTSESTEGESFESRHSCMLNPEKFEPFQYNLPYVKYWNIISILLLISFLFKERYNKLDTRSRHIIDFIEENVRLPFTTNFELNPILEEDLRPFLPSDPEIFHPINLLASLFPSNYTDNSSPFILSDINTWKTYSGSMTDYLHEKWIKSMNETRLISIYTGDTTSFIQGSENFDRMMYLITNAPNLPSSSKPLTLYSINKMYKDNSDILIPGYRFIYPRLMSTSANVEFIKNEFEFYAGISKSDNIVELRKIYCCIFVISGINDNYLSIRHTDIGQSEYILAPREFVVIDTGTVVLPYGTIVKTVLLEQA